MKFRTLNNINLRPFWVAPKPIPDKANHPNLPHIQSIEYAEHADRARQAAKHRTDGGSQLAEEQHAQILS